MRAAAHALQRQDTDELEGVRTEQREANARAIRLFARECHLQVSIPAALPDLICYWDGDADAIESGLACIERVQILVAYSGLPEVVLEFVRQWLLEASDSLMRFR
jgi:hypothetical protein